MATATTSVLDGKINRTPGKIGMIGFGIVLIIGVVYAGSHLLSDLSTVHSGSWLPYLLLGLALLVALGFEFVNGFHDTANAVATVIYTHSMEPHIAVVWSGFWNFLGVLNVQRAGGIRHCFTLAGRTDSCRWAARPGFAMVFALLVAAIIWNLGTWYFGLPASSSHTMIGSIIGVGIANQLMSARTGTSGVDWGQATEYRKIAVAFAHCRVRLRRAFVVGDEGGDQESRAVRSARRQRAAAVLDPFVVGADLHRREFCAWVQRWAKRHGTDHAYPGRYGSYRLRS